MAGTYFSHKVVNQPGCGIECFLVAGKFVPRQKSESGIFTTPYVPLGKMVFRGIVAYVAVGLLRCYDLVDAVAYFVVQRFVVVVAVRGDGALHPFAPELCLPRSGVVLVGERFGDVVHVLSEYAGVYAVVDA